VVEEFEDFGEGVDGAFVGSGTSAGECAPGGGRGEVLAPEGEGAALEGPDGIGEASAFGSAPEYAVAAGEFAEAESCADAADVGLGELGGGEAEVMGHAGDFVGGDPDIAGFAAAAGAAELALEAKAGGEPGGLWQGCTHFEKWTGWTEGTQWTKWTE